MTTQTTATTFQRVSVILEGRPKGDYGAIHLIAQIIDNETAKLEDAAGGLAEAKRELETLRADNAKLADRLARTDVGPRPTDERIADALEKIAGYLGPQIMPMRGDGSISAAIDGAIKRGPPSW